MQLESIEIKGLGVFRETQLIDFTQLSEGLIAIVGRNGHGKSTFLEAIYAALFRDLPTKPGMMQYVNGRDAHIHLRFRMNGKLLESRLLLDGDRSKQDAFLFEDGAPVDDSNGKLGPFDRAVKERVGTKSLMLSSVFSPQNRKGNFLELRVGDRKDLFVELLGLGHIPAMEKRVKDRVDVEFSRIRQLQESITKVEAEEKDLETAKQKHIECDRLLEAAKANLATAIDEKDAITEEESELTAKASEADAQIKADRAAVEASSSALTTQLGELTASIDQRERKLRDDAETAVRAIADLKTGINTINTKIENNRKVLAKREQILQAVADIPTVESYIGSLESEIDVLRTAAEERTSKNHAITAEEREVETLERGIREAQRNEEELHTVPCHAIAPYDSCSKIVRAVDEAKKIPALLEKLEVRKGQLQKLNDELAALPDDPGNGQRVKVDVLTEQKKLMKQLQETAKFEDGLNNAEERIQELTRQLEDATKRLTDYETPADTDEIVANLQAQQVSLARRLGECRARSDEIERRQTETVLPLHAQAGKAYEQLQDVSSRVEVQRGYVSDFEVQLQVSEKDVERLSTTGAAKARFLDELKQAEGFHSDWTRIAKAYGKNGIPALEIDAAGPVLSELINELVSSCFSSRFYFKLRTQREKADGDLTEDFDIEVTDNVEGWKGTIDNLSGGQKVIAAEAIGLAIALYNKADHPLLTLFRDETTGALDPETAPLYVEMLRKAMKLGGFHRVLFITHNPDAAELADAVLVCQDNSIQVARI